MNPGEMRRLVSAARVGRLATIDPEGRLHLVPICFVLEAGTLYSAVDEKPKRSQWPKRLDNVRAHPDVAVLVDHYDEDWSRLWWIRLRGRARVLEGGEERERAIALLERKYEQYRRSLPRGPVLAVALAEWRGWAAAPPTGPSGEP